MAKVMKPETKLAMRKPFAEVPHLMERLDEMITERWMPLWGALRGPEEMALRLPPVDVFEDGTDVVVKAELAGLKKDELEVEVGPETVTISGKKSKEEKVERRNYYRFERASGAFTRTVRLPAEVELEKARAEYKDGILEIRVPKSTAKGPTSKKIEIG